MPTDVDARGGAGGNPVHSDETSPDLVGEELGDGARIWRVYDEVAREEDRERIGNWNRGLDNLALFAGLFSAVTTAFIIQLQQDTQPDYARLTFLVLNASVAGVPFHTEPFAIEPSIRTTNCLWIASLMLSLTAALIAIMGKDWIGMYASRPVCNPRQWAEIRTYRVACVERWYMSGVIASAPVLLHVSLVLFAAGLVIFAATDPFSQRVALGLALAAGGLYLVTALSALVFPTSPFKSPAAQAVRGAVISISTSVYDRLAYLPKRRPVEMLQKATLLISAGISYPLPRNILPLDPSDRRRLRTGNVGMLWNRLLSDSSSHLNLSWRATCVLFARNSWARSTAFALSFPGLLRSALNEYHYRHQRPRPRPWLAVAKSYLRQIDLRDHWEEVRSQPTPDLMAQSLSRLSAITQSSDVLHAINVALGDIVIGRQVAPLVSFDLRTRLSAEIRPKWPKVDLTTLSRFILSSLSFWDTPAIPLEVIDRFSRDGTAVKSESIVFALVKLPRYYHVTAATIAHYCPAIVTQPHGLQYLLPNALDFECVILLAERYWDLLEEKGTMLPIIKRELRRRLMPWARDGIEAELVRLFGPHAGLFELLVVSLDHIHTEFVTSACAWILKVIVTQIGVIEHPCLVYAFGHASADVADAAWAALPPHDALKPPYQYYVLEVSLPLDQFTPRHRGAGIVTRSSDGPDTFYICLIRTIVRLLLPSRYFYNAAPRNSTTSAISSLSTVELCVRGLHTQLFQARSALNGDQRLEMITSVLENSVLVRLVMLREDRQGLNFLCGIARFLSGLLASGQADDFHAGARLFCLYSYSEATNWTGEPVLWSLGAYLSVVSDYIGSEVGSDTATSMRRLLAAIRALRPLCTPHDDLRAAWECINLAPDEEYHDSFWDAIDFDLGPLLDPDISHADTATQDTTIPQIVIEEFSALYWLDAAMH